MVSLTRMRSLPLIVIALILQQPSFTAEPKEDKPKWDLVLEVNRIDDLPHAERREDHVDWLKAIKETTKDRSLLFAADYFIGFVIWRRDKTERFYKPFDRKMTFNGKVRKRLSEVHKRTVTYHFEQPIGSV